MDFSLAFIYVFLMPLIASQFFVTFSANIYMNASNDLGNNLLALQEVSSVNSSLQSEESSAQARNLGFQEPYFCGQILGGHFMFGSASSYCGGYSVQDCSALCFYRNFTFFQCEGFVCHCFTRSATI